MPLKTCSYINCENYICDNMVKGKVTLFQFPKDPNRRKIWMENGKVTVPPNFCDKYQLYMCTEHFHPNFVSVNKRRTVLVGAAVPYPAGLPQDVMREDSTDYIIYADDIQKNESSCVDEETEEAPSRQEDFDYIENYGSDGDQDYVMSQQPSIIESAQPTTSNLKRYPSEAILSMANASPEGAEKRTAVVGDVATVSSSRAVVPVICPTTDVAYQTQVFDITSEPTGTGEVFGETSTSDDFTEESLVGANVTTFIFKGEEYVQLRKEDYVQEKRELLGKLRKYEKSAQDTKQLLLQAVNSLS